MKKKFIIFFCIFALSLCLIPRIKTYAAEYYPIGIALYLDAAWTGNTNGSYTIYCQSNTARYPFERYSGLYVKSEYNGSVGYECYWYDPINDRYRPFAIGTNYCPYAYIEDAQFTGTITLSTNYGNCYVYSSEDDYYDNIPEEYKPEDPQELKWYEQLFNDFIDYIGAGINNGIDGFLDWLREAWITPVGEGEDDLALDLITPTPTPTPLPTPTPIPYQTQLVPDGNGGYNITYIYNNPSGVPTSAPQPPTNQPQPTGSGSNDDDFDYPYYNNPNNKDDPYTLDIPWYLKFSFGGAVTSLDDFQEGMDAIVDNVNDQDENISVVMDSMGLFPNDWLLMIGFIGAIPLVGGLISRLLKG